MNISKLYEENEAKKLGFFEDEDEQEDEPKMDYESWFEKYGARED